MKLKKEHCTEQSPNHIFHPFHPLIFHLEQMHLTDKKQDIKYGTSIRTKWDIK